MTNLLAFILITLHTNEVKWDNSMPVITQRGVERRAATEGVIREQVVSNYVVAVVLPDGTTNQWALTSAVILERELSWSNHTETSWITNQWQAPSLGSTNGPPVQK